MTTVDRPQREAFTFYRSQLLALEKQPRPTATPSHLPLERITVYDVLFQPRETSLVYRAKASQRHVETMARVVSEGSELDPIVVVAFGPQYVLIDGHHRLEAYQEAAYASPVPVQVIESELTGEERITWAIRLSASLNSKNKLAMSDQDKMDVAWRLTVVGGLSKREVAKDAGVGTRSVANMRSVAAALRELGHQDHQLYSYTWHRATFELRKAQGQAEGEASPDALERRLRRLVQALSPALEANYSAPELLAALEQLRPGIGDEFKEAMQEAAARADLDI